MGQEATIQNFKNLVGGNKSKFVDSAKASLQNIQWKKRSQDIALAILERLDELNMKQSQLANIMSVTPQQISKIVKGHANLTLESISKIESALGISLISISQNYVLPEIKPNTEKKIKGGNSQKIKFDQTEAEMESNGNQFAEAA